MTEQHPDMIPQFGMFVSPDDNMPSEISFGGHNTERVAGELKWVPVVKPELGHWQVQIRSVKVGNETIDLCNSGECAAIVDTGTSLVGAPRQIVQRMQMLLARVVDGNPADGIDCRGYPGPQVTFDLGGVEVVLGPEDYSRPAGLRIVTNATNETQFVCRASLLPMEELEELGSKMWIFGEPVLRKYYSVFDWQENQIGFAPSIPHPVDSTTMTQHTVHGAPSTVLPPPTVVYL